jgi:hypothetical protein
MSVLSRLGQLRSAKRMIVHVVTSLVMINQVRSG